MFSRKVFFICLFIFSDVYAVQFCSPNGIESTTPYSSFKIGVETVKDIHTGLVWMRCSEGQQATEYNCIGDAKVFTWEEALRYVYSVNKGVGFLGFNDWRLPDAAEIESIVEGSCYFPAINLGIFPDTPTYSAWSSSPVVFGSSGQAWSLNLMSGAVEKRDVSFAASIRLVRGGY